jgi:hypothetical protein
VTHVKKTYRNITYSKGGSAIAEAIQKSLNQCHTDSPYETCSHWVTYCANGTEDDRVASISPKQDPAVENEGPIEGGVDEMIGEWREVHLKCRGSSDPAVQAWSCDVRRQLDAELARLGYCYGRNNEAAFQYEWHRCGADSIR